MKTLDCNQDAMAGFSASDCSVKRWTKRDSKKLQSLTRKIVKMDGGDRNIRRMAYECEVRARGDSPNAPGSLNPVVLRPVEFTNTETSHPATLPGIGKDGESPKGLGRDGNKPLMRNRTANEVPSPIGVIPATLL